MHPPSDATLLQFRNVLRSLAGLSDGQQILLLKCELLGALERARDAQRRSRALELDRLQLKALAALCRPELRARFAELHHRLMEARRGLPSDPADRKRRLLSMRLELLETRIHSDALDAMCRGLLRGMDRPDPALVAGGPTQPTRASRAAAP